MNPETAIFIGLICLFFCWWVVHMTLEMRAAQKRYEAYLRARYNASLPAPPKQAATETRRCPTCGCRATKLDCFVGICGFCEGMIG